MSFLQTKPDAEEALDRMERWWLGQNSERALLTVGVKSGRTPASFPAPATVEEQWLNFEGRIAQAREEVGAGCFFAETFPAFEPNLGPDVLSTLYGLQLQFAPDTSWGEPVMETLEEILAAKPDFGAPLWQKTLELQRMALAAGEGQWITLFTDLHPNADILSALLGAQECCLAFADDPDLAKRAAEHVTEGAREAYRQQVEPLVKAGLPVGCWMRAFSRKTTMVAQCDFSAMIGPRMFEEAILPSIAAEMTEAERVVYHLDGPDALRHLDAVLSLPGLQAVQWVYGAGKGPARRWAEVYRKLLDAGKAIVVEAESREDLFCLAPLLGKEGVWFKLHEGPFEPQEAEELLNFLIKA